MKIKMESYNNKRGVFTDVNGVEWSDSLVGALIVHLLPFDVEVPEDSGYFQDWLARYEELKEGKKR